MFFDKELTKGDFELLVVEVSGLERATDPEPAVMAPTYSENEYFTLI